MTRAAWIKPGTPVRLAQADLATSQIESAVDGIAQQLLSLSDRLNLNTELALDSARFAEVPGIGEAFTQPQVLATIDKVAEQISGIILAVLQPPLGPYVTAASTEILSEVDAQMKAIRNSVTTVLGIADGTVAGDNVPLADAYIDSYLEAVSEVIMAAERLVVMEESGNVDVYEPDEKNGGANLFAVAGIAAVVALMVAVS